MHDIRRPTLFLSLVVAVLAALLFTPGLPGAFLFDDIPNIVNNSSIHLTELSPAAVVEVLATPQVSGSMRGLPTLSFALDYWRAGGADPGTFKTTNILIHALTAFALAWFFRSLLLVAGVAAKRAGWLAVALAMAWAAHPLQVSSVLYVVQRLQTMGTLFLVLALLGYLVARQAQIQGNPSRSGWLLAALAWGLALGCKEDSVLLPAYTLAMELTVLRFAAAEGRTATRLRRGYLLATLAALAFYVFWAVPHYWSWDAYPGRNFSSIERLLTEARVLCMYLWQILLPLPQHMPFYYDWIEPSRSLLRPWTTLPAIALIVGLLGLAWRFRHQQPLFALGIFLFFSAHLITSNVVGLELAYEHRNHFALIGAVLAIGSLLAGLSRRAALRPMPQVIVCIGLLSFLAGATLLRAHDWRSPVSLAQAATQAAPTSPRAWIDLCVGYLREGGGVEAPNNPNLNKAIDACASGADSNPETLNSLAVLVALKTLRGDINKSDWARFQTRLQHAHMSWDNARAPLVLAHYAGLGVPMDKQQVLDALGTLLLRVEPTPSRLAQVGYAIMDDLAEPDLAIPYFIRAIEAIPVDDPFPWELAAELREKGRPDLAKTIEELSAARYSTPRLLNGADPH